MSKVVLRIVVKSPTGEMKTFYDDLDSALEYSRTICEIYGSCEIEVDKVGRC